MYRLKKSNLSYFKKNSFSRFRISKTGHELDINIDEKASSCFKQNYFIKKLFYKKNIEIQNFIVTTFVLGIIKTTSHTSNMTTNIAKRRVEIKIRS